MKTDLHDQQFRLVYPGTDIPISNQPYRLIGEDGGLYAEGVTDANGFTERVYTSKSIVLSVEVLESESPMVIGDKDGI